MSQKLHHEFIEEPTRLKFIQQKKMPPYQRIAFGKWMSGEIPLGGESIGTKFGSKNIKRTAVGGDEINLKQPLYIFWYGTGHNFKNVHILQAIPGETGYLQTLEQPEVVNHRVGTVTALNDAVKGQIDGLDPKYEPGFHAITTHWKETCDIRSADPSYKPTGGWLMTGAYKVNDKKGIKVYHAKLLNGDQTRLFWIQDGDQMTIIQAENNVHDLDKKFKRTKSAHVMDDDYMDYMNYDGYHVDRVGDGYYGYYGRGGGGEPAKANIFFADNYYYDELADYDDGGLYNEYDDDEYNRYRYDRIGDMDLFDSKDGSRAGRFAGYNYNYYYYPFYRLRERDRNLYERRNLVDIEGVESNGFAEYEDNIGLDSIYAILLILFVLIVTLVCIFGAVLYHYTKHKDKMNDEYKARVIQDV